MALIKILAWEQRDSIGVDPNNPESRVENSTIINPISTSHIHVHLLVDGEKEKVVIDPPYNKGRVIAKIKTEILSNKKEDEGKEFTVTL